MSRRELLAAGIGVIVGAISACREDPTPALREKARALGADLDCSDVALLRPAELVTRTSNEYRQHTERGDQFCLNCLNYESPSSPSTCGTCKTVKGPINPDGWCKQWTTQRR